MRLNLDGPRPVDLEKPVLRQPTASVRPDAPMDIFTRTAPALRFEGNIKDKASGLVSRIRRKPGDNDSKIFYVNHTHWDREWYRLHAAFQVRLSEAMDDIINRLDTGELKKFCLDGQSVAFEDYLELQRHALYRGSPAERKAAAEKIEKAINYVKKGRIEIGPWFVQPDLFLVSGESLVRNLKKGMDTARRYGGKEFFGYLPDPFGQPADMPLIFNGFGIDKIILWRGGNPDKAEFFWKGRDGSKALVRWYPYRGYSIRDLHIARASKRDKAREIENFVKSTSQQTHTGNVLLPLGGDHLGATPTEGLKLLKERLPDAKEVTFTEFMKQLEKDVGKGEGYERIRGHLLDNTHANILQGVYSARLYLKQQNRRIEHRLTKQAEPLVAMSQLLLGEDKKPRLPIRELEKSWTHLLYNQPHDSICGCSIDEVHVENESRFNTSGELATDVIRKQMAAINAEKAGPNQWVVVNTSGKPYTGVVKVNEWQYLDDSTDYSMDVEYDLKNVKKTRGLQTIYEGLEMEDQYLLDIYDNPRNHVKMMKREALIWVENIPPFGVKVVDMEDAKKAEFTPVYVVPENIRRMTNGLTALEVADDGTLSVTDLKTGKTYDGLHRIIDQPEQGDSYNSAPVPGGKRQTAKMTGFRVVEQGRLRSTFEITYELPETGMPLVTRVSLEAGNPVVLFETDYTNTVKDHKMQVSFPTGQPVDTVRAEGHFGIEDRQFDPGYNERNAIPANRKKGTQELKTNTGAIQRFVMANGQQVMTEGLTEYEVSGENLNITLLRAFGKLSDMHSGARDDEAGPPFDTPAGQMLHREMTVRYGWQPAPETDGEAYAAADRFYGVTAGEQGRAAEDMPTDDLSLVRLGNPHVAVSTVKLADNGKGLLVRMINTTDRDQAVTVETGFDYKKIWRVDFAENRRGKVKGNDLTLKPNAVETLLLSV